MKTFQNLGLPPARSRALHRHEAYLFKLLLRRQLRWSAIFKQLWRLVRAIARVAWAALILAADLFAGAELTRRESPYSPPAPRDEWERYAGGPPRL